MDKRYDQIILELLARVRALETEVFGKQTKRTDVKVMINLVLAELGLTEHSIAINRRKFTYARPIILLLAAKYYQITDAVLGALIGIKTSSVSAGRSRANKQINNDKMLRDKYLEIEEKLLKTF